MSLALQGTCFLLNIMAFVLLIVINVIIHKAGLHDNQYHLIRFLTIADTSFSFNVILFVILVFIMKVEVNTLSKVLGCTGYWIHGLSLTITIFLTLDRLIAVKHAIYYQTYVTKARINKLLLISAFVLAAIVSSIYIFDDSEHEMNTVWYSTYSVVIYTTCIRLLTCICIIVFGKITRDVRNKNEARLAARHSSVMKREELKNPKKLRRSIKDIIHLNFWTCIFIIPASISSILMLIDIGEHKELWIFSIFAFTALSVSNPIIYIFSFNKIRKYIFKQRRTNTLQ